MLTGSALLSDTGLRYLPVRVGGRVAGLLGPGASTTDVHAWMTESGLVETTLELSGAVGYFRGVKG